MGQINADLFNNGGLPGATQAGVYASELPLFPDNINAGLSRYTKIAGIWPSTFLATTAGYPAGAGGNDSWAQPVGNQANGQAWRPSGGYFVRGVWVTDQNPPTLAFASTNQYLSYGYVGSFIGGYDRLDYTFDINPGPVTGSQTMAVDYEPVYGHGTVTTIANAPVSNIYQNEWRDSANLTGDPTATVTLLTSNYSRTPYSQPAFFVAQMDSATNNIGSGTLRFHLEMRPTQLMSGTGQGIVGNNPNPPNGARAPLRQDWYGSPSGNTPNDFYFMSNNRKFGSRALSIFWGRIFDGQSTMFAYPYYEDQTFATYLDTQGSGLAAYADLVYSDTVINDTATGGWTSRAPQFTHQWIPSHVYTLNFQIIDRKGHVQKVTTPGTSGTTNPAWNEAGGTTTDNTVVWTDQGGAYSNAGPLAYNTDNRIREAATLPINDEYFLAVQETKFAIFSNKTGTYPLVFLDLTDTWNAGVFAAGLRIAGAAVWNETTPWAAATAYAVGQAILDTNGNIQVVTAVSGTGTSGGLQPTWNTAYNGTTTDNPGANQVVWTNYGINKSKIYFISESGKLALFDSNVANSSVTNLTAAPALASGQAYGALRIQTGFARVWSAFGSFAVNPATTSTDNGGTPGKVNVLPYNIVPATWGAAPTAPTYFARHNARSLSEMTKLRNGNLALLVERVGAPVGSSVTNTGIASITNVSLTTNVVTITAANNYLTGQVVLLNGLTNATFLNGSAVTVLSSGLSGTSFQANFTHANYASAADTGTATDVEWQVMLFNPAGAGTWNTNQLFQDSAASANFSFGTAQGSGGNTPISYENAYNCYLYDVAAGPTILIQSDWRDTKLFVVDGSQALSTISNTNITNVSRGSAKDIFSGTTAPAASSPLEIRKSATDDRTLFWFNETYNLGNTNAANTTAPGPTIFYLAPPSWTLSNWNQTIVGAVQTINQNAKDGSGNVLTIDKDKSFLTDVASHQGTTNNLIYDYYSILGAFSDHACNVLIHGGIDSNLGAGQYGLLSTNITAQDLFGHNNWQATFYLPTYFKWNGSVFVMADNYAQAVANPAPVSATPGTNINLPYGLVAQFGTTAASSFGLNEWFTINVAWGNTKFVRKARYAWSMFAGQTFLTTQSSIPMTVVNSVIPTVLTPEAFSSTNITFPASFTNPLTGQISTLPAGFTQNIDNYLTCANWPMISGGVAQNNAVQIVMTVSHPDPSTILNRPNQANQVYRASSSATNAPVSNAFNGCPYPHNNGSALGVGGVWISGGGAPQWIAIDLGSAQTVRSYSFNQAAKNTSQTGDNYLSAWRLFGSNSATDFTNGPPGGTWNLVDTRTGIAQTRSFAGNVATPNSYRYYALLGDTTNATVGLGFFRLFSAVLSSTMNFNEILAAGPNAFLGIEANRSNMAPSFMRGMTFEVSTNGGTTYTTITPLWRAHIGGIWCFSRQTGVTNVRITVQSGYPWYSQSLPGFTNNLAIGPFQFGDYQVSDTNAARLGSVAALDGTPTRGSFDSQFMGISADSTSVSIDTTVSAASLGQQYTGSGVTNDSNGTISPVYGWWTFTQIPTGTSSTFPNGSIRVHPVYGYVLFGGPQPGTISFSGGSDQDARLVTGGPMSGTNLNVVYHWGRRT